MAHMETPQYPAGPHTPERDYGSARREELIEEIASAPVALRASVAGLTAAQLETRYRNWTVWQIVHHIADSHLNAVALHARWVTLLRGMTEEQFERAYFHPEAGATVRLAEALSEYAWHGRHHTGQIVWLRRRHSWR